MKKNKSHRLLGVVISLYIVLTRPHLDAMSSLTGLSRIDRDWHRLTGYCSVESRENERALEKVPVFRDRL